MKIFKQKNVSAATDAPGSGGGRRWELDPPDPHIGQDAISHLKKLGDRVRIWSYEHGAWWRPNSMGYTTDVARAGLYSPEEADAIVKGARGNEVSIRRSSSVPKCVDELMSAAIRLDPKAELLGLIDAVIDHYDGASE